MQRYSLPHLTLEGRHMLRCRPQRLVLNCNSTRMAVLDQSGLLTMFDFGQSAAGGTGSAAGEPLGSWERKDVWDVRWASDDPELLVCCEKGKMVVVRWAGARAVQVWQVQCGCCVALMARHRLGCLQPCVQVHGSAAGGAKWPHHRCSTCMAIKHRISSAAMLVNHNPCMQPSPATSPHWPCRSLEAEEPVAAPGHVLELADLEVRCAALDALMAAPEQPAAELISTYETRGLRWVMLPYCLIRDTVVRVVGTSMTVAATANGSGAACLLPSCCVRTVLARASAMPRAGTHRLTCHFPLPAREARDLLASSGVAEATAFISSHSHPRLWRILANHCLQQLDLATAEKALVHCQDYPVRAGQGADVVCV